MNGYAAIVATVLVTIAFGFTGVAAGVNPGGDSTTATSSIDTAGMSTSGGLSGAPKVGAAQTNTTGDNENEDDETDENETGAEENESVAPGARLAGVLGAQQEELKGEVENRAFGHAIAAARSNGSKAKLVANNTEVLEERLQKLEQQLAALNESYENGSIPEGMYNAKVTGLSVQIQMTERLLNQTADSAQALPPQARMAHGVNVSHLEQLRSQAGNMSGPEIASIARNIAGPGVGQQMGPQRGPPNGTPGQGPPDGAPGPSHNGDAQRQNGSGNMGPPGANQTDTNTTTDRPRNASNQSGNQSGQGNGQGPADKGNDTSENVDRPHNSSNQSVNQSGQGNGQGPADKGNDTSENVDRSGLERAFGNSQGVIAAIVRSMSGLLA